MAPDVLIHSDTHKSAALRHELPLGILDPFSYERVRPGVTGRPVRGRVRPLGHGVGLEVHEEPSLGRTGMDPLVAGDVVAIEPGCYRLERLTDFRYELAP